MSLVWTKFASVFYYARRFSPATVLQFLIHLPNFVKLGRRLLADPRVPFHLKLICYASLVYLIIPFDLIPITAVMFFGLGLMDDALFIFLAFKNLFEKAPKEVVREHVEAISAKR